MAPPRATVCRICAAPRFEGCGYALCQMHFAEFSRERKHACRAKLVQSHAPDARRLEGWLKMAVQLGATADESWRVAMAISVEYDAGNFQHGVWMKDRMRSELAYLRSNADALAALDAKIARPVAVGLKRGEHLRDDGWDVREAS